MSAAPKQKIAGWRFAGGILLHAIAPAYLGVLATAGIAAALGGLTPAEMLGHVVALSGWFLAIYLLLGALTVAGFALFAKPTPRVVRSIATARSWGSGALPDALATADWDSDDPELKALASDLVLLVEHSDDAIRSAPPERREALRSLAAESLVHLAAAHQALIARRSALDEGDARTVARYVETRYGPSDFAGDA